MAEESGPIELQPIELRIGLPEGRELDEELIKQALYDAAEDPTFVQRVKDFFAVSQNDAAVATVVRQIPPPHTPTPPPGTPTPPAPTK